MLQGQRLTQGDFIAFDRLLNCDALTIGFARRFATYKRAPLIFQQFENIVKFMSGRAPSECDSVTLQQPGSEKCIAIVYEGHEAIRKIRDVLGPTDPSKAPPGSIRREFGSTIMVNAAHASDSVENARREMGIVRIGRENIFHKVIEEFYGRP